MKIGAPQLVREGEALTYRTEVTRDSGEVFGLTFQVPAVYEDWVSDRSDAALLACLLPAMRRGEDIEVLGTTTDELMFQLQGDYQVLLRKQKRRLHRIAITASSAEPPDHKEAEAVITGFSAGVDSWQVLAQYYYADNIPESLQISHLLYNDVGSHGQGGADRFERRLKNIQTLAEGVGLPVLPVVSNMELLYRSEKYMSTHTVRNAAVPWLLQNGVRHFYYASAYDYSAVKIRPTRAMAEADIAALPLLSASHLTLRSVGSAYTRVQKTNSLVDIPATFEGLDVCISPQEDSTNCSNCWKCRRTMLTLDIAGVLDRYYKMFDLQRWERIRYRAWSNTVEKAHTSPLIREVVRFGQRRGYDLAKEFSETTGTNDGLPL